MLIKEVCQICNLTKKAVDYYEQQGLIKPQIMENGYRNYSGKEVSVLKEISVLRKCGIGIQDIRMILESVDKSVALARYKHLNDLKMKKLKAAQDCIDGLIQNYDIERSFHQLQQLDEKYLTVQEKLVLAFPGNYGLFVSLHFGRFLHEPIQTEAQQVAYGKVIAYLDHVAALIPDELSVYMEQTIQLNGSKGAEKFEDDLNHAIQEAIHDPDAFFINMRSKTDFPIEGYIAYRTSEEFRESPAGKMANLMIEFQKSSEYQDVFIANLKILSPAYQKYCKQLEEANVAFLERYPQAGTIYGVG